MKGLLKIFQLRPGTIKKLKIFPCYWLARVKIQKKN